MVLAARGKPALEETASECSRPGAETLVVPTDVRREPEVQALAEAAVDRFGRFDVWVLDNGHFEQIPSESFRAVIETNLMGQIHGSRAVLPHFRSQNDGTLINLAPVWARVSTPDVSPYVTSKFAVRAFSGCLCQELADTPTIKVATMLPQAVDTPIFANSGNYSGPRPRPIPPMLTAEEVAHGIIICAQSPKREVTQARGHLAAGRLHSRAAALTAPPHLQNEPFPVDLPPVTTPISRQRRPRETSSRRSCGKQAHVVAEQHPLASACLVAMPL